MYINKQDTLNSYLKFLTPAGVRLRGVNKYFSVLRRFHRMSTGVSEYNLEQTC